MYDVIFVVVDSVVCVAVEAVVLYVVVFVALGSDVRSLQPKCLMSMLCQP